MEKQSVSVTDIGTALQVSPSKAWRILRKRLRWYPYKATNRYIEELKTTVNVFGLRCRVSVIHVDVEKSVRHIRDRARASITKFDGQFEGGLNRLRMNWDGD